MNCSFSKNKEELNAEFLNRRVVTKFCFRRRTIAGEKRGMGYHTWTEQLFKIPNKRKRQLVDVWLPIEWGDARFKKNSYRYSTVHKKVMMGPEITNSFPLLTNSDQRFSLQ
jgi:hypothetical protein